MKNILKIGLTACLILGLSGCYSEESRLTYTNVMADWFIALAYLIPLFIASLYQFKVSNSKWYISIMIVILTHITWIGFASLFTGLSFSEIVKIFY